MIMAVGEAPTIKMSGFTSVEGAKSWCDPWLAHFYLHIQLKKQLKLTEGWLKDTQERYDAERTAYQRLSLENLDLQRQIAVLKGNRETEKTLESLAPAELPMDSTNDIDTKLQSSINESED
jgi:hypothetical protein